MFADIIPGPGPVITPQVQTVPIEQNMSWLTYGVLAVIVYWLFIKGE